MGYAAVVQESGIILVVPEVELLVGAIRDTHDRVARLGVPAHITLLYPWCTPPIEDGDLDRLRNAIKGFAPFALTFRGVGRFERTLYLRPDDDGQTATLTASIAAAFPEHPPYGGRFPSHVPHLTVAEVESPLEPHLTTVAPVLLAGLPIEARATAVTVMESGEDGRWSTRAVIPLG